jgi:PadR family transcriptional regulator, regulatory protein PadR
MTLSYNEIVFRNLFLGFIRLHILYHASKEQVFGLSLIEELARHGYHMSPGTLYPILHQMESNGLLSSEKSVNNGKARKYYRTTQEGLKALAEAREKLGELCEELREHDYKKIAERQVG